MLKWNTLELHSRRFCTSIDESLPRRRQRSKKELRFDAPGYRKTQSVYEHLECNVTRRELTDRRQRR